MCNGLITAQSDWVTEYRFHLAVSGRLDGEALSRETDTMRDAMIRAAVDPDDEEWSTPREAARETVATYPYAPETAALTFRNLLSGVLMQAGFTVLIASFWLFTTGWTFTLSTRMIVFALGFTVSLTALHLALLSHGSGRSIGFWGGAVGTVVGILTTGVTAVVTDPAPIIDLPSVFVPAIGLGLVALSWWITPDDGIVPDHQRDTCDDPGQWVSRYGTLLRSNYGYSPSRAEQEARQLADHSLSRGVTPQEEFGSPTIAAARTGGEDRSLRSRSRWRLLQYAFMTLVAVSVMRSGETFPIVMGVILFAGIALTIPKLWVDAGLPTLRGGDDG
ncbi:hypothetical protein M0E87_11010 [Corynebacterium sp. CCM 9185]|uniref:Uncharacterized protein n=1 Tax=Corynebacterium marambiense TaxID=2765364 RepID=A0ABS0VUH5_9CORY|nr:hypothetical protein [Corynebacterium marambiense]MBI9000427.1 hypothetical protein [Corynebacterium marambiense]MCK7664180.1 hypothetical protein [Corynebacterium marambiense]MCX7543512.1 hypothetical protein [Corynebacterium marambiense]